MDKGVNIENRFNRQTSKEGFLRKNSFINEVFGNNMLLYLMTIPGIIYLLLFAYLPMMGIYIAFTDYNIIDGIFGSKFIWFNNFKYVFTTGNSAYIAIANTLILNTCFIITGLIFQISVAVFINEIKNKYFKTISQSMLFFPYFLSWIVIGAIIYSLFSSDYGLINTNLKRMGLETLSWYSEGKYWKPILTGAHIWKWTGYGSIVYLAAMSGFEISCYEAAIIDGASRFQQLRYITLPFLKPTAIILTLFSIGRIFYGDFGMIYGIIGDNGVLQSATEVIDVYVFRAMRTLGSFAQATAIGILQSVMGLILIIFSNKGAKRINDGEALF